MESREVAIIFCGCRTNYAMIQKPAVPRCDRMLLENGRRIRKRLNRFRWAEHLQRFAALRINGCLEPQSVDESVVGEALPLQRGDLFLEVGETLVALLSELEVVAVLPTGEDVGDVVVGDCSMASIGLGSPPDQSLSQSASTFERSVESVSMGGMPA